MPLSIGVEIEGVALKRAGSAVPFPLDSLQQLRIIVNALKEAGLDASVYFPTTTRGDGPNYTLWNVTLDATVSEVTSESTDSSSKFRSRFGFELVSPIFYDTDSTNWKAQFQRGVNAVQNAVKWKANRSTGLHVHVGRGELGVEYAMDEVKKIAIFHCRFERVLDEFHPLHRSEDNENVMSNRNNEFLKNLSIEDVYSTILKANDIAEVCRIVNYCSDGNNYDGYSDSRFFKVNFTSLQKHKTIEFRQHEGTNDSNQMIKWIQVILKIVNFAINASYSELTAPGNDFEDMKRLVGQEK